MTPPRRVRPILLTALLVGLIAPAPAPAADDAPPVKVFVGYLYGPPRELNFGLYTHLCHAFVTADADGRLRANRSVPDPELTKAAHAKGVRVLVSLGGWGWDEQFAAMVKDPDAEDRYVAAVLKLVDENDYDGIDLDWEYPDTAGEVPGWERLSRRLRDGIDAIGKRKGRPMELTMAVSSNPGTLRWLDPKFLLATYDWINVMTYDMAGDWTPYAGHNAPLFASSKVPGGRGNSVERALDFLVKEHGVPADRLAVGLPLYGRAFAVAEPYAPTRRGREAPRDRLPRGDYANLHRLIEQGWTRTWDDETQTPWLLAPDKSAVVGYDDAESLRLKTEWAMRRGFRGVFFWQVHGDRLPDGSNPLQAAARAAWEAGRNAGR